MPPTIRKCKLCEEDKPLTEFNRYMRLCKDCEQIRQRRSCRRCRKQYPYSEFLPGRQLCSTCREVPSPSHNVHRHRKCNACKRVLPRSAFPAGGQSYAPGSEARAAAIKRPRVSTVCQDCWNVRAEKRAREEAAKPHPDINANTWQAKNGELVRRCSKCGHVGLMKNLFYPNRQRKDGSYAYNTVCKHCTIKRANEWSRRLRQTKEGRARHAKWRRDWRLRNPEQNKEAQRRYFEKLKNDPVRRKRNLENRRILYRLQRERMGKKPVFYIKGVRRERGMSALPARPLADALDRIARIRGLSQEQVAALAGTDARTIYAWRHERDMVQWDVADAILQTMGLNWWDVWDVKKYPEAKWLDAA